MTQLDLRPGDVVRCLLDSPGPGSEEHRRKHGHECELKVVHVSPSTGTFDGQFEISDLDDLFDWIRLNDGVNGGEQIGDARVIPDVSIEHVEEIVTRAPRPALTRGDVYQLVQDQVDGIYTAILGAHEHRTGESLPGHEPRELQTARELAMLDLQRHAWKWYEDNISG